MAEKESPRIRILRVDYERVKILINNSDFIHVDKVGGNPPESYLIRFTCKGIAGIDSQGTPIISENHRVMIELHKEYPVKAPHLKWTTPIFHPNFHDSKVCINDNLWSPEQRLDDLIIMLGRMIQFQHYNTESVLNSSAQNWTRMHQNELPLDDRPLHRGVIDKIENNSKIVKIRVR